MVYFFDDYAYEHANKLIVKIASTGIGQFQTQISNRNFDGWSCESGN